MSDDFFQEDDEETISTINPTDSYSNRFEVKPRAVGRNAKPSFAKSGHRIWNSKKIFTKKHNNDNPDRKVNMTNTESLNVSEHAKTDKENDDAQNKENSVSNNKIDNSEIRSNGLDSLFSSTVDSSKAPKAANSFDPDKTVAMPKQKINDDNERKLRVLKPTNFNTSASDITYALKNGIALVICVKNVAPQLGNRVLDFAFGAASMCGAHVSVEADRTYSFTTGPKLSKQEKLLCIKEGVPVKVD